MNLTRKRWRTLIACCFINLCLGSIYVWSVFAASMAEFLSTRNGVALTTADLAIVPIIRYTESGLILQQMTDR